MRIPLPKTILFLHNAFGRYRWHIVVLAILGLVGGILEGVGVNIMIPLFSVLTNNPSQPTDRISKIIIQVFHYLPFKYSLTSLLLLMVSLFIFRTVILLVFNYVRTWIGLDYKNKTLDDILSKTLYAGWPFLLRQKLGHIQKIFILDVDKGLGALKMIGNVVLAFSGLLMYFFVAVSISPQITLITLGTGVVMIFLFQPLMKKTKLAAEEESAFTRRVSQHLAEHIIGIKTVKVSAAEEKVREEGLTYFERLRRLNMRMNILKSFGANAIQPLSVLFTAFLFGFYFRRPDFNLAAFAVIIYLIQRIFTYIQSGYDAIGSINEFLPYAANAIDFQKELGEEKEERGGNKPFVFRKSLQFKEVNFAYDSGRKILSGLNFEIKKGETVGLIGPSGAGKTSVADLSLRLFQPTSGNILLDGASVEEIDLAEWRRRIGYVSQDIFLLNHTIGENIKFYSDKIGMEEINEAAKKANIYDFIVSLPKGFDTTVGERGVMLSAGQRQRIVLARVLARQPEILILDEATSALDNESELLIQKAIHGLYGKMTVFIIAHRLSTVAGVDKLLVLDHGKIIEAGEPQALLKDPDSYFYKVYNLKK